MTHSAQNNPCPGPQKSILVAGLSPAWQQIQLYESLVPGEVNRASQALACASGKVLNVSMAIASLAGAENRHTCICMIGGSTGALIEDEFNTQPVETKWIKVNSPTRVCTTLLDKATGQTTELVENAAPVTIEELEAFRHCFREEARKAEIIVLTGSLPLGAPSDYYQQLLGQVPPSTKVILDVRGQELWQCLPLKPYLVKPNREELEKTVNRSLVNDERVIEAMQELISKGAGHVLVSHGKKSTFLAGPGEKISIFDSLVSENVNPIGCGDCLTGGIAWGLANAMPLTESIKIGIAAAAENASQLLPARLDLSIVKKRKDQVKLT